MFDTNELKVILITTTEKPFTNYTVYMLHCSDDSYYVGYTSDIERRLYMHQHGCGSKYTFKRTPVKLIYTEQLPDKLSAMRREKQIKKYSIYEKENLIQKEE